MANSNISSGVNSDVNSDVNSVLNKAAKGLWLSAEEGTILYDHAPLADLMYIAHEIRIKLHPDKNVTWIIDRNVNYTNICTTRCKFCNFSKMPGDKDAYITTYDSLSNKIKELYEYGGRQILIQGGINPELGLLYFTELFSSLKKDFPWLKLHALGPHEIHSIAGKEKTGYDKVLRRLVDSGLDSLPGAGAEILSDRVRKIISPGKCSAGEWLAVMREAHKMRLVTSATMMYGHAETINERMEHLAAIRKLQSEKPEGSCGFISFTAWPFQSEGTVLATKYGITGNNSTANFIRMNAIIRIMLPNIPNIQASWLTAGREAAQLSLCSGVNDMGSIMMEENVVSSAGAKKTFTSITDMRNMITEAGFIPVQRDQNYNTVI